VGGCVWGGVCVCGVCVLVCGWGVCVRCVCVCGHMCGYVWVCVCVRG